MGAYEVAMVYMWLLCKSMTSLLQTINYSARVQYSNFVVHKHFFCVSPTHVYIFPVLIEGCL